MSDLKQALICALVAEEHLMVRVAPAHLAATEDLIKNIAVRDFSLTCASINYTPDTVLEDLPKAALEDARQGDFDTRRVVNVVLGINLEQSTRDVQVQALELMRSKRVTSRAAIHSVPKPFLFIALIPDKIAGVPYLMPHLNDYFMMSVTVNEERQTTGLDMCDAPDAQNSTSMWSEGGYPLRESIVLSDIEGLQKGSELVRCTAEITRYTHDIVSFMRLQRGVRGGISALATRHLFKLSKVLSVLHSLYYVTPALVALACRLVFVHRIILARANTERSVLWGSDMIVVERALQGTSVDSILADTLMQPEQCRKSTLQQFND